MAEEKRNECYAKCNEEYEEKNLITPVMVEYQPDELMGQPVSEKINQQLLIKRNIFTPLKFKKEIQT